MTEKDKEIQDLCRELRLAKAEIDRIRAQRDAYWEQLEYQLKEKPNEYVESLDEMDRGSGGFGSTGK